MAQFQADSVCSAATELATAESVEKLFLLILALGNYMNKGARGNSPGFKLSSLNKLRDTKTQDGKSTLLHYLVSSISKLNCNYFIPNDSLQAWMPESDGNPMAESDKFFFCPYGRERQVFLWF